MWEHDRSNLVLIKESNYPYGQIHQNIKHEKNGKVTKNALNVN